MAKAAHRQPLAFFLLLLPFASSDRSLLQVPLSDRYNNSAALDDRKVTFFWSLSHGSISIAAKSERKTGYLAVGFGETMAKSFAYVGWVEDGGKCHVGTYWINGRSAKTVHRTSENLTDVACRSEDGIVSFEFLRPLLYACSGRVECENVVDPMAPLKVIWAMGHRWSESELTKANKHFAVSDRAVRLALLPEISKDADLVGFASLAVHGLMMFVAWGVLFPAGILVARFSKHANGALWIKLHLFLQAAGLVLVFAAAITAATQTGGIALSSGHVKFGLVAIFLVLLQPISGNLHLKSPAPVSVGDVGFFRYFHVVAGRSIVLTGLVVLFSGLKHFADKYDSEVAERLAFALILWILVGVSLVIFLELTEMKRGRKRSSDLVDTDNGEQVNLLHEKCAGAGDKALQLQPQRGVMNSSS